MRARAPKKTHAQKYGLDQINYRNVKGRYCLVKICTDCNRMMHDTAMESLYKSKWGDAISEHRVNGRWFDGGDICLECKKNNETFCNVYTCEICNKTGSHRSVRYRSDIWLWDTEFEYIVGHKYKDILCTGCWNRARAVRNRYFEAENIRLLINRLKKEICNERKNQNDRRNA